ncbi:MAG: endopeptidase La [Clostridiales bacterium]|nr:endopeptidase La [Clostridiales bacterium]
MPERKASANCLPLIPLRGIMLFPHMTITFDVSRTRTLASLDLAMRGDQRALIAIQKDPDCDDPVLNDLYPVGIIVSIRHVMNLPGETVRIMVEGKSRAKIVRLRDEDTAILADYRNISPRTQKSLEMDALWRGCQDALKQLGEATRRISPDVLESILAIQEPGRFADVCASNAFASIEDRMDILLACPVYERLEKLLEKLMKTLELEKLEMELTSKVHAAMEKSQREYYLREQIKAAQAELGDTDITDADELRKRLSETPLNDEAREKCAKEIDRLARMTPGTPEITTSLTYIEWILDMPWGKFTEDNLDITRARAVLDEDHYGLDKVKERIIEYLAVLQVKKDMKGPILCFVGPPGVGKTSIVRAIAKAVGRRFVQMSLGGIRDEAEIRGHRRTYVGSIPGRIISGIKQAGVMNPVFLFDEIDKMANDTRGDPASAMLEVLDSEQNMAFRDHYMEIPFDLSKVMFITTANSVDTIPGPLYDRMEIIEVPSYTEEEKLHIACSHLLPKQAKAHGLQPDALQMSQDVMRSLIEGYTREAGVRSLERVIAKVVRKGVVNMLDSGVSSIDVTQEVLHSYLGAVRFTREMPEKEPRVGIVTGLAYTTVGGETLEVECTVMPGRGSLKLTGKLGDVMKESAEAAFSWVRSHSHDLGLADDFYKESDVHIHCPEGAVTKDGPSAGVTLTTALTSAFTGIPVRQDVAMTGEITLRGRVLPIGGLKEKTLAAYRAGIRVLVIPKENMKDLEEIPAYVLSQFRVVAAEQMEEILREALVRLPDNLKQKE